MLYKARSDLASVILLYYVLTLFLFISVPFVDLLLFLKYTELNSHFCSFYPVCLELSFSHLCLISGISPLRGQLI